MENMKNLIQNMMKLMENMMKLKKKIRIAGEII